MTIKEKGAKEVYLSSVPLDKNLTLEQTLNLENITASMQIEGESMFKKRNFIMVGVLSLVLNLTFWLGLIAGILWLLKYFGVFAMFS